MKIKTRIVALAGLVGCFVAAGSSIAKADLLRDFNLVVVGNLDSQSEVEGRTIVGGNLNGPASNYGIMLTPASSFLNTDVLIVGGNLNAQNINMNAGNLRHAGANNAQNINFNGGGQRFQDAGVANVGAAAATELNGNVTFFNGLASNSVASFPNSQPGPLTFNCSPDSNGVAVFNVAGSAVFSNNLVQSININFNGATSVVINVSGSSVNFTQGNFVGNFTSSFARSNVLWNMGAASSIDMGGKQFNGALLAPNASLFTQGVMEGSVFVGSFLQRGEVHLPGYRGIIPAPGAATMLGLGMVMAGRRRR
jgi:choice-of-anchor A domain-containing protein